jgi:cell division protein YceG involved in septum cleavage
MNAEFKDITKEAFIIAYRENFGNITIACHACGISRTMYQNWMKNDNEFKKALAEIEPEELMLDWGEHKLMERITKGDTLATMFLLKTKGKRRGYIEKTEVLHEGDVVKQITVNVVKPSELPNLQKQLDGDENIMNFDTQKDNSFTVPATLATEIAEIPLYDHDKGELLDMNDQDEFEE